MLLVGLLFISSLLLCQATDKQSDCKPRNLQSSYCHGQKCPIVFRSERQRDLLRRRCTLQTCIVTLLMDGNCKSGYWRVLTVDLKFTGFKDVALLDSSEPDRVIEQIEAHGLKSEHRFHVDKLMKDVELKINLKNAKNHRAAFNITVCCDEKRETPSTGKPLVDSIQPNHSTERLLDGRYSTIPTVNTAGRTTRRKRRKTTTRSVEEKHTTPNPSGNTNNKSEPPIRSSTSPADTITNPVLDAPQLETEPEDDKDCE